MRELNERRCPLIHVLCEVLVRMRAVGLAKDHSCEFPITQTELGDATGKLDGHPNFARMSDAAQEVCRSALGYRCAAL